MDCDPIRPTSSRKARFLECSQRLAPERERWIARNAYFHQQDLRFLQLYIPPGLRILDLGCGTGHHLNALQPALGVGVDFSPAMIAVARQHHPHLQFHVGDVEDAAFLATLDAPFDVILLSDTLGYADDCLEILENLHGLCAPHTRILVSSHSHLWEPVLTLGQRLGLKTPQPDHLNWFSPDAICRLMELADFEIIFQDKRFLFPKRFLGLGPLLNRYLAPLPLIRDLCLRHYVLARSRRRCGLGTPSVSVVIPCRNERDNIEAAVIRMPRFAPEMEILFIEGHSQDGTWEEIERVRQAHPDWRIRAFQQQGKGKGDAVRLGFDQAEGEVLMILDADLTVPPENLPQFYRLLAQGKGEFIHGTRLVYPMEQGAMRFLNHVANRMFGVLFSYLLNQSFTDTLCGTKVLTREAYQRIARNRSYFGEFDPFGDFDLLFGAAKLGLKIVEVPIRYLSRNYGTTQISRFRDGWLLIRMVLFAFRKIKTFS